MAKGFKATWLGDDDIHTQAITEGGVTFVKGEPVSVPANLMFNGMEWAERIRANPVFAIDNEDADVVEGVEEDERNGLMEELDKRQIAYRTNASLHSLRKLLADNT